jgi:hypothetical protein
MEAYSEVYAPQEELTEEQVWEEVENWVNSLVEEGYDLSEYTWEDMYESYLSEAIGQPGSAGYVNWQDRNSGQVRSGYKSSSDGKLYKNYNDALAARNSRMKGLAVQQGIERTFRAGGGNAAVAQGKSPLAVVTQGSTNLQRQQRPAAGAPAPAAPAARPAAAPARPAAAPARPAAGTQKPAVPASTPAAPAPRQKDTSITDMIGRSQVRQGAAVNTGSTSSDARAIAARSSVGASPSSTAAKPTPSAPSLQQSVRNRRLNMDFDPFDVIKGHLLDEGYADTEESALAIMTNMSETWKEEILEGVLGEDKKYDRNRQRAAQRAAARNRARQEGKTGNVPGVGYVSPRPEGETYRDSAGVERHTSGARMPKKDS